MIPCVRFKQFACKCPLIIKCRLHARMAFFAAVAQCDHCAGRAFNVILYLFQRFGGNRGDPFIRAADQLAQQFHVIGIKQKLPHHCLAKIPIWTFNQNRISKIPCITQHRQIIGAAPCAFDLGRKSQPHLRLSQEIKRNVGQGDIFFDNRRMTTPFADAVR